MCGKAFSLSIILVILCITLILSGCSLVSCRSGSDAGTAPQLQETEETEMEEQHVISRYQAIQQAMIDRDVDTLDEIILDGTIFTHMSGKTQTKEEYFADIRDGRLDYQRYTMTDAKVVINGNDAMLTCRVVLTANAYGAQGSWPFNVTAHLVRIDGEWYMTN